MLSFLGYGPFGQDFHDYWYRRWHMVSTAWRLGIFDDNLRAAGLQHLDFTSLIERVFPAEVAFFGMLSSAAKAGGKSNDPRVQEAWECFRHAFDPPLPSFHEILAQRALEPIRDQMREAFVLTTQLIGSNGLVISYAIFAEHELAYMGRYRLLDVGCGTGYVVLVHRGYGGDAIGVDNNERKFTDPVIGPPHPWVPTLMEEGRIVFGDCAEVAARYPDRALGLFYAEPGTDMLRRTLTAYRGAGGQTWLWKPGACFGSRIIADKEVVNANLFDMVVDAYMEIGGNWRQITDDGAPRWNPWMMVDGLFAFRPKEVFRPC